MQQEQNRGVCHSSSSLSSSLILKFSAERGQITFCLPAANPVTPLPLGCTYAHMCCCSYGVWRSSGSLHFHGSKLVSRPANGSFALQESCAKQIVHYDHKFFIGTQVSPGPGVMTMSLGLSRDRASFQRCLYTSAGLKCFGWGQSTASQSVLKDVQDTEL